MGTRAVYALGLTTLWAHAPDFSYARGDIAPGPVIRLDHGSLVGLRLLVALCAVLGAGRIGLRFGWPLERAVALVACASLGRAWIDGALQHLVSRRQLDGDSSAFSAGVSTKGAP
jgi:hypothetical protein